MWPEIQQAIEGASAYTIVVSPESLQSRWVGKELRHALDVQTRRGKDQYPVIPLSLNGTRLGVLEEVFGEEPIYIPVSSVAGGVEAALDAILAALGARLPADIASTPQPQAEPLEELVLDLTDLKFHEEGGVRRASARAKLVYHPAQPEKREVVSAVWRFIAPLGPIEAEELRWYLEKYAIWPSTYFRDRARKVEENLVRWGQVLHDAAMPVAHTANVMQDWARIDDHAGRRFSVHVEAALEAGAPEAEVSAANEAATALLGLPWELLHDGDSFLFQGAKPTRVRRRLPNKRVLDIPVVAPPIRILLVTARPEDDACGYIDHRASALPLVEAMEALPGLVRIHMLSPPTLLALREELDRARRAREPYHVVHFDGHGVYERTVGLGGLCFEDPRDADKLEMRRHATVYTDDLGPLLRDHRVPLVFLEACQTALAEKASESVASALLEAGVASVVAMSHSVLVETARRFVEAFYDALAQGERVGDAMLAGQRHLKDDPSRGRIFGVGELRLEDWFVPVLFQEKGDPQLFRTTPSRQTREDFEARLRVRFGELPAEPPTGFVGRSRELLALQRLLHHERYAVVRGQGGEGKTALSAEFARWMVRSHQIYRVAFVSVETHSHAAAVLDAIGRQLVPAFSVATFDDVAVAIQTVERALVERPTLLVIDNMESILLPPFMAEETPAALSEESRLELDAILKLCARLNEKGDTRLVFTSREPLPAPFDAVRNLRELHQLDSRDAVKLIERVLNEAEGDGAGAANDAAREEIESLVNTVHGHARTLALLAPALRNRGVEATRAALVELMEEMEEQFPGNREKSVLASVELSLRRLSPENRERARVLGVFHGSVDLDALRAMTDWEPAEVGALSADLVQTGLATPNPYNHLTLNPALCPYLRARMDAAERDALTAKWIDAMGAYVFFLVQERYRSTDIAARLAMLELANLFALLECIQLTQEPEAVVDLTTKLHMLLQPIGRTRLLDRVTRARDAAERRLSETWSRARFESAVTRVRQDLYEGRIREAVTGARELLERAQAEGEKAYSGADYDLATAFWILAQVYSSAGLSEQALKLIDEARSRFEAIERDRPGVGAARMAYTCFTVRGDSLERLGRLDEAAASHEEGIRRAEKSGDVRAAATGKGQLGKVRLLQKRYAEALTVYGEARERFESLNEPSAVAVCWHQIGVIYQETQAHEAAEDGYRRSLAINTQLRNIAAQASTLAQLGILYDVAMGRTEEAVQFLRQAVDKFMETNDLLNESQNRSNLAIALLKLQRWDEAREEIQRALQGATQFGHDAVSWTMWGVLAKIEAAADNTSVAAEARRNAIFAYLAYRRDGGENHYPDGRIAMAVTRAWRVGGPVQAAAVLRQAAAGTAHAPFVQALQQIVAGQRDPAIADDPALGYTMAAEILLLLERLEELPQ